MTHRLTACLVFTAIFFSSGPGTAAEGKTVQDLHYGDVLFHFYKEDYFTAITRVMSVLDRGILQQHVQDAELLLGGMELTYGLPNEAKKQFQKTFNESVAGDAQQRSWYYLGKSAYQRGLYEQARNDLNNAAAIDADRLSAQHHLLLANINMLTDDNQTAAEQLKNTRADKGEIEYIQINQGIALLRNQQIEAGKNELDELGQIETDNPELRALRDRANLNLGYEMLRNNKAETARMYLNRVRLHGLYAESALLGAGWADAALGDFNKALTPWLELIDRSAANVAVQEAHLAVPFAFERLNDTPNALHYYDNAIHFFDQQLVALSAAKQSIEDGALEALTPRSVDRFTNTWSQNTIDIDALDASPYLIDILASNEFQQQLKNYRDLTFLNQQLQRWALNIKPLHDVVDTLRQANAQRAPSVKRLLEDDAAAKLQARYNALREKITQLDAVDDPIGLATTRELQQWQRLESLQERIARHPELDKQQNLAQKTKWLKGILAWQIQTDYESRLANIKALFAATESPVRATQVNQARVARVLKNIGIGFAGDDNVIDQLQARIQQLEPGVAQARVATANRLKTMALTELSNRQARVQTYLDQAHYALARSYDRLAQQDSDLNNGGQR